MQQKKNVIVDFVAQGKDLLSDEGKQLIRDAEQSIIREAVIRDSNILSILVSAREKSSDPHFRRKILLSISD